MDDNRLHRAGKPRRPSPAYLVDSNTSSITAALPSEPTSSGLAVVKQPNEAKTRRTTKSVFGTLGISILNPTISTTPTPTTSVTVPTSTAPAVKKSSTPPTTEEKPTSTDTASVHPKCHVKQVQQLLPPPPRQITTRLSLLSHPYEREVTLMADVGERALTQSREDQLLPFVLQTDWHLLHRTRLLCRLPRFMNKPGLQTYHLPRTYKALPYGPSFTLQE
ncbi:hypothetical protein M378DRAFT_423548 [Amanita muscaria Koide BX008]|uniref:Uncharacterized protein n=1 Tax=Amanita muscaria (strain Koide BX008) TaxID=946122 RepID=A0A0C2WLA9_AMAMK|nr:hypothetical protein M378DRAFT_423548 [Amanita muscaria Koide BX008]